jgi:hypothetical protein
VQGSYALVTHGRWDLEVQLWPECRRKGLEVSGGTLVYYDLKQEAQRWARYSGCTLQNLTLKGA